MENFTRLEHFYSNCLFHRTYIVIILIHKGNKKRKLAQPSLHFVKWLEPNLIIPLNISAMKYSG